MKEKLRILSAYTCIEKPINMDRLISLLQRIEKQKKSGKLEKPETGNQKAL